MKSNQSTNNSVVSAPHLSYFQSYVLSNQPNALFATLSSNTVDQQNHLLYFNSLFSPQKTTQSLQKKNQNFQMINFQNSDSEPDQVFVKRKEKVNKLKKKEEIQLDELEEMRKEDLPKYLSFVRFMKFLFEVKNKIEGTRTDYYSTKTFCALKNSSQEDLASLTSILKKVFASICKVQKFFIEEEICKNKDGVILEFLIIPRFLISKEKISRICRDEQLQENFQFLIQHQCLGHYNNEANKKLPEENQMKFIRELLIKSRGREKFKRICSINHGNKFLKNHGNLYYELYFKNLSYLKYLDNELKKGKKFSTLKQDLSHFSNEISEEEQSDIQSIQSHSQSHQSSSNRFSFSGFNAALNNLEKSIEPMDQLDHEMDFEEDNTNKKIKKFRSIPLKEEPVSSGFKVRKSMTLNDKKVQEPNIILIEPPKQLHQI